MRPGPAVHAGRLMISTGATAAFSGFLGFWIAIAYPKASAFGVSVARTSSRGRAQRAVRAN